MDNKQKAKDIRIAIKSGDVEKVVEIIGNNPELLNMDTPFGTWLHVAASKGKLDLVKKLIELGSNVNKLGGVYGGGALNEAASAGHLDTVVYLINSGAKLDVSEPEKNPLFGAISSGHVDVAEVLIESGIDTTVTYHGEFMKDMDALKIAKEQGQEEIVGLLENQNNSPATPASTNLTIPIQHVEILEPFSKFFGPVKETISEIVQGSRVSIDINIISSSQKDGFITLVTTGMSDIPMEYSIDEGKVKYAELLMKLPSHWAIKKENSTMQEHYWPLEWLRKIAHIPHIYDGWIDEGVILPNGEPPQPFASNTDLSSIMLCKPQETELIKVHTSHGNVDIYTLIPIYEEERQLALNQGHEYLMQRLKDQGVTEVLDLKRKNVAD